METVQSQALRATGEWAQGLRPAPGVQVGIDVQKEPRPHRDPACWSLRPVVPGSSNTKPSQFGRRRSPGCSGGIRAARKSALGFILPLRLGGVASAAPSGLSNSPNSFS